VTVCHRQLRCHQLWLRLVQQQQQQQQLNRQCLGCSVPQVVLLLVLLPPLLQPQLPG
jgi:hypothetical protein